MTNRLQITIVYEDGGDGWIMASIPRVPGTISQGRTRAEARANVLDALQLMLMPDDEDVIGEREAVDLLVAP